MFEKQKTHQSQQPCEANRIKDKNRIGKKKHTKTKPVIPTAPPMDHDLIMTPHGRDRIAHAYGHQIEFVGQSTE
jgi:hypothetical protein